MYDGISGEIFATEHSIDLTEDALPILQMAYGAEPGAHELEGSTSARCPS